MTNKKRKDTFGNGLIAFLFVCMIFLMGYAFKNPILLYSTNPEVEINHEYDPKTNIQQVFYHSDSSVQVSSDIDTKRVGNYTVTYQIKDYKKTCTVSVKDTTLTLKKDTEKPVISTDPIHVYTDSKPNYKSYIEVTDNLDLNPKIKIDSSKVKTKKEGTYKLTVTATDRSGNKAKKKISVVVEEPTKVVYLTFDDGPSENTDKVLKILKKYDAKATFFVTGNNQKYNDSIRKAEKQGNTIALHTYTHDYATVYSSTEAYFNDLQQISDMVKQITGKAPKYIRFPGGSSNMVSANYSQGIMSKLDSMVHERGYEYFDWNCSSGDAASNSVPAQTIVDNSTNCNYDQIMLLFHDSSPKTSTVEALPAIIENYKSRGYVFKAISDDTPIFHHGVNN